MKKEMYQYNELLDIPREKVLKKDWEKNTMKSMLFGVYAGIILLRASQKCVSCITRPLTSFDLRFRFWFVQVRPMSHWPHWSHWPFVGVKGLNKCQDSVGALQLRDEWDLSDEELHELKRVQRRMSATSLASTMSNAKSKKRRSKEHGKIWRTVL